MAEEVLSQALNADMPRYPVDVQRALDLGAKNAEDKAGIEANVAQKQTELMTPAYDKYQGKIDQTQQQLSDIGQQQQKPFEVPKETAADFAQLGGLVAVIGAMLGTSGKMSANNVLAAITGTLEGYKSGRKDVIANSIKEFDTNMKRLAAMSQNASAQLELYTKSLAVDKDKAAQVLAQYKANLYKGVAGQDYKASTAMEAIKTSNEIKRLGQQAAELSQRVNEFNTRELLGSKLWDPEAKAWKGYNQKTKQYEVIPGSDNLVTPASTTPRASGGGSLAARYAYNMDEAFAQAATDVLNVAASPADTVMGSFAGMSGKSGESLVTSLSTTLSRNITPEDQRLMQLIVTGLDQHMARALGGGYANSSASKIIDAYKEQLPREGDSPAVTAMFLARIKQELGVFAKEFKGHPGANDTYLRNQGEYMDAINKAIPFSVQDVLAATRGNAQTKSQAFSFLAGSPSNIPLPGSEQQGGGQSTQRAMLNGRVIVVRGGKWVYEDTGQEAK